MTNYEMERVNGSFLRDLRGQIMTPVPTVRLIKDQGEFTRFLSDRRLFFDGRFMIYEGYDGGDYFDRHDLIALIVDGECELAGAELKEGIWQIALKETDGTGPVMYFLTVGKASSAIGAEILKERNS